MAIAEQNVVIEPTQPTVSWGAVIGGAFIIAATSIILLALGAGFGLSAVSPWPQQGASVTTFAIGTAVWLIVVQWLSAALGAYVAGRLGARWVGVTLHEAYFRDTAHGVLAWAVAAVFTIAFLASAIGAVAGGAVAVCRRYPVPQGPPRRQRQPAGGPRRDCAHPDRGGDRRRRRAGGRQDLSCPPRLGADRAQPGGRAEAGRRRRRQGQGGRAENAAGGRRGAQGGAQHRLLHRPVDAVRRVYRRGGRQERRQSPRHAGLRLTRRRHRTPGAAPSRRCCRRIAAPGMAS